MTRPTRRQRSTWPLAAWPLLAALLITAALITGACLDERPLRLIPTPAPTPGTSPTPQETTP